MEDLGSGWLAAQLQLTEAEVRTMAAAMEGGSWELDSALLTVQILARHVGPGLLPMIVRRSLPAFGGSSLVDVVLTDPRTALALVEQGFDWSGIA
jgi:hypothetical protein